MASRNKSRNRGKRPTATLDLKAKDVSERDAEPKVDANKVLSRGAGTSTPDAKPMQQKSGSESGPSASDPKTASQSAKADSTSAKQQGAAASNAPGGNAEKTDKATPGNAKPAASKPVSETKSAASPKSSGTAAEKSGGGGGIGGTVTHLLAGGVGGVLAFLGAGMFGGDQGSDTAGTSAATEALATRLAALESRKPETAKVEIPAELTDRVVKLESLSETIAKIQQQQTKLTAEATTLASGMKALADPAGGGATELRQRLDSMESTISSLGKAAKGAGGKAIPELAALAGRINDMRTEMEAKIIATQKTLQADVAKQVAAVETAVKSSAEKNAGAAEVMETLKGGNQRLSLGLETARTETARIAKSVAALRATGDTTTTSLEALQKSTTTLAERMSGLESKTNQSLSALPGKAEIAAAVAPVTSKVAALETALGGILKRETERAASAKNVLLSIELANLQRALDQGRPISAEIKNLQANAPSGMDLTALSNLASKTVVGHDELARQFSRAASAALQSENLDEDAGTFDKLLANARSIVRIRKTGDVEGTTTEAVLARAEDNLKRGDLAVAVKELAGLDGKAAAGMKEWLASARDRLAVDVALAKVEASLKAAVSSSATN